jgi:ketosteroid isomerase-like protein
MSDIEAIQQLMNRYSEGACRRDWPQMMATFTADGEWLVPERDMALHGHAQIAPAMAAFVAQMDYFVQLNSAAVIEVEGDRATARSVIREVGKFAASDIALEVLGHYTDDLVRTAEGWKFARRTYKGLGLHRFDLLTGPPLG